METYPNTFYHLYNRTNNNAALFRTCENHGFFLKKYRFHSAEHCRTLAYCLMPTHFHFFMFITSDDTQEFRNRYSTLLSSYTQAFNKLYGRHGALFQKRSKAKPVNDNRYAATLAAYTHNNPVRADLVSSPEEWEFSSYRDYCSLRSGTLVEKEMILSSFSSLEEFRVFSESIVSVEEHL